MKQRINGLDLARAFAIFGMVIVNFKIAMGADYGNPLLLRFVSLFEGRASALFVLLAGVGITFLTQKALASRVPSLIVETRKALIKRGLLLLAVGLLYTPIWEADILHFYGCYFLLAAVLFLVSNRALIYISGTIVLSFPVLMLLFDYDKHWDWTTLTYTGLWSVDGMIRHILFNGFHPVFPWAAFLIFGMWLGRQDLSQNSTRKRLFFGALTVFVVTELAFYLLRAVLDNGAEFDMTAEEVELLVSISVIPPLPQYMISAGSSAVVVMVACLYLSDAFSESKLNKWLVKTGQMSLTLYVLHVVVGMGFLEAIGRLDNQSIGFSLLSAGVFCICGLLFSVLWLKFFSIGPLEWLFRKVSR